VSRYLSPQECAAVVTMSDEFIRGEIRERRLAARQFKRPSGRSVYRIDPDDFRAYLEKHWPKVAPTFHVEQ
jgi:hypothetical protein